MSVSFDTITLQITGKCPDLCDRIHTRRRAVFTSKWIKKEIWLYKHLHTMSSMRISIHFCFLTLAWVVHGHITRTYLSLYVWVIWIFYGWYTTRDKFKNWHIIFQSPIIEPSLKLIWGIRTYASFVLYIVHHSFIEVRCGLHRWTKCYFLIRPLIGRSLLRSPPNEFHYNDVIMSAMASQITNRTIVCSTVYSGFDQQIKENIKAPCHWPLWGEFTVAWWIPRTKSR